MNNTQRINNSQRHIQITLAPLETHVAVNFWPDVAA